MLDLTTIEEYNESLHTAQENLLAYLYFCEALEKRYQEKEIGENILLDTLSNIVIWTNIWFSLKNEIGLAEAGWIRRHLLCKLFRIGRLQFEFEKFEKDYPAISVKKGENLVAVHIPADGKLSEESYANSFAQAKDFFEKYFSDFHYRFYFCHSWLLDDSLKKVLGENANICQFGSRFQEIERNASDAILRFVFRWDETRENLSWFESNTRLTKALKIGVEENATFYEVSGVIFK